MPATASLELLLRYFIVALPVLVLIVLFFLLAASRPAQRHEAAGDTQTAGEIARESQGNSVTLVTGEAVRAPTAPAVTPQDAHDAAEKLEAEIAAAEEAGETIALAKLYLALGRARLAAEEEAAGLDALRSSAGLAGLYKAHRVHAEARLELADAAIRHGDPTTACEHWQMARMAFLDEGAKAEGDKIDRRMRAQGCPTDWVLTDF